MADYVTNARISVPLYTGLSADVDLGGLKFSYQHGIFYDVQSNFMPLTAPAPGPPTTLPRGGNLT